MGHPMELELTCVGLPVKFAIHYTIWGALLIEKSIAPN